MTFEELAGFTGETIDLSTVDFTPALLSCVPSHVARKYRALPVFRSGERLGIALSAPPNIDVFDSLTHLLHLDLVFRLADEPQLRTFLDRLYGAGGGK